MRIAIVGVGGVGGYYGARFAAGGVSTVFLARGRTLEAIQESGITVESPFGDLHTPVESTDDPDRIGPCDAVFICVKSYDTQSASSSLDPLLKPDTAVITLQNGINNAKVLSRAIGAGHVVGGATYIFSTMVEPGRVVHSGGPARIIIGEMDGSPSGRVDRLVEACSVEGVSIEGTTGIVGALWRKLVFLSAIAGMTTTTRLPLGDIRRSPSSREMFRHLMEEVAAVAALEGMLVETSELDSLMDLMDSLPDGGRSSMYEDLVNGRPLELHGIHGAVLERGRSHGIPTPAHQAVVALLEPWAAAQARPA